MSNKIINFGSINIDHVYRVHHMPCAGETISAQSYEKFLGGKGINQSIAAVKAGGTVLHIGAVAAGDAWTFAEVEKFGIDCANIKKSSHPTGHAIIFVDDAGENEITILGGANQNLEIEQVDKALQNSTEQSDWILLQTETNLLEEIVEKARNKDMKIAYAAAPFIPEIALSLIDKIDLLAVNEGEAEQLANALNTSASEIPVPSLLITKGASGAIFYENDDVYEQTSFKVDAIDTTGAGDTFLGSFLALYAEHSNASKALEYAAAASAIQVTRPGAASAIPERKDVEQFLQERNTI